MYPLTFLSLRGFLILILSFLLSELLDQSDYIFFKAVGRLSIPIYFKCDIINLVTSATCDVRLEISRYLRKNMERLGLLLSGRVLPVWKAQIQGSIICSGEKKKIVYCVFSLIFPVGHLSW